jgi:deoxyribose-phosphate aldolase
MALTAKEIAKMMDLSCVRTNSTWDDIKALVNTAVQYEFGQVSIMQCFISEVKEMIAPHPGIHLVGNVSFPSGSDSTSLKVFQAQEMVAAGCDEIDVVMNVAKFLSGREEETQDDLLAVVQAAGGLPVKVIIEAAYLTQQQVQTASRMAVDVGAAFVKTGTGWTEKGATVEDVRLIKSVVGERIQIKASGGIRSLATLLEMYTAGARRFGVNLRSGKAIVEEALQNPALLTF